MKTLFTREQIQQRIAEMAKEIDNLYKTIKEPIVVLCVSGGEYFCVDLTRAMTTPLVSYIKGLDVERVENMHVLVVDSHFRDGLYVNGLFQGAERQKPKSIHLAVLLDQPNMRLELSGFVKPHFVGFTSDCKRYLTGMGVGYNKLYRNHPEIFYFEEGDDGTIPRPVEKEEKQEGWSLIPAFLRG